ncbi:hypothetical protein ASF58_16275 [Methylobacterium sp. Leaf125]|nr:hypothetical protein ASF58_16275 [Methylobacterium sp. Leaf125]
MENLSAETILLLLAKNPSAQHLSVTWQFADLEAGGWEPRESFVKQLSTVDRVLLVTEGSSDGHIIRRGLELLHPEIADFFYFADVKEGYPFSGEGNLANFAKGLASIDVINDIIFIFDNDAAGVAGRDKIASLGARDNMRVVTLPDLDAFHSFRTIGPMGERLANINGCAVAIECYLDLGVDPIVRWTSYNSAVDRYQGELIDKTRYAREFIKYQNLPPGYDLSKLAALLDMLIATYAAMKEKARLATIDEYMLPDA